MSLASSLGDRLYKIKQQSNPLYRNIETSNQILLEFEKDNGNLYDNPLFFYWLSWAKLVGYVDGHFSHLHRSQTRELRDYAVKTFSWAIPTRQALSVILEYGTKILSIGSGAGYWESLLVKMGGDVTAVDEQIFQPSFFPNTIKQRGEMYMIDPADGAEDSTLLLVWPHFKDVMINVIVNTFMGQYLILVGEKGQGCTWSMDYYELFIEDFQRSQESEAEPEIEDEQKGDDEPSSKEQNLLSQQEKMMDMLERISQRPKNEEVKIPPHDKHVTNGRVYGAGGPHNAFQLIREFTIPTWEGICDVVSVYKRIDDTVTSK